MKPQNLTLTETLPSAASTLLIVASSKNFLTLLRSRHS
jgi:hypothetical protein